MGINMKKKIICLSFLLSSVLAWAQPVANFDQSYQQAKNCQDLRCVRGQIDNIDAGIISLLVQRLAYVRRAGELRRISDDPMHDPHREEQILNRIARQAEAMGYPANTARIIFGAILAQSNIYENQFK